MPPRRVRLAARRRACGYSQEAFAEALQVDRTTVARWESGETEPQPWHRRKIARLLEMSLEVLDEFLHDAAGTPHSGRPGPQDAGSSYPIREAGISSTLVSGLAGDLGEGDETNRRNVIAVLAGGVAAVVGRSTFGAAKQPMLVVGLEDGPVGSSYVEISDALASLYRTVDPLAVLPIAAAFADDLLQTYENRMPAPQASFLELLVGLHCQVGLWACHAHRLPLARRYLAAACDLAAAADPPVRARALGALSYLHSSAPYGGVGGNPGRALDLLNHALSLAAEADAFTRGWLATWRADQHAALGDIAAAQADVELATTLLEVGDDDSGHGFFARRHYGYGMREHLASVSGLTHALAGELDSANRVFDDVQLRAANARRRVATFGHQALGYARRGQPDAASDALTKSITLAVAEPYPMGLKRAAGIRAGFDRTWTQLPCVRDLDERLAEVAAIR
jgi:DNA-binding XRE family transcriptional regulator